MNYTKEKIISPLKFHGAKYYLARRIISSMEYRPIFVEGFCCTSVITLNLDESFDRKYCFDLNPSIINFWRVLQNDWQRLYKFMSNTEYSQENFFTAKKYLYDHRDEITDEFFHASMFLVCNRMSRSADMKTFGWSDRIRRDMPEYISAYKSMIDSLPLVAEHIKDVIFDCGDYTALMIKYKLNKDKELVQYLDPPYIFSTRITPKVYGQYEMTDEDHTKLLDFCTQSVAGITYISGYPSNLYKNKLTGCNKYSWQVANSASQVKSKPIKTEILWVIND